METPKPSTANFSSIGTWINKIECQRLIKSNDRTANEEVVDVPPS